MTNAQDRAFAALAIGQGLLSPEVVAELEPVMTQGDTLPQLLAERRVLAPSQISQLLRDLARTGFGCSECRARFTYDSLARLERLRCPGCGGDLVRRPRPAPSTDAWPSIPGSSFGTAPGRHPRPSQLAAVEAEDDSAPRSPLQPTAQLGPGERLGPYTLGDPLGKGSYGLVFLATREGLQRPFALKVMIDGEFADEESIARFQLEAAVASKIDHPGVIGVYDVGREGDRFYYAMDYCPGKTLKETLRDRERLEPHTAAELIRRVAETMVATHAKGVIHRDLKPSNIIIEAAGGLPRVTDFGLARDHSLLRSMTQSGDVLGTPHYMAPEQFRGERDLDHRIDIYALGVIFYQCLTGRHPYTAVTPVDLAKLVCEGAPRDPHDLQPEIPPALAAICLKAMACDPDDRYVTASALVADLARLQSGQEPLAARNLRPAILLGLTAALVALIAGAVALGLHQRGKGGASSARTPPSARGDPSEARRLLAAALASLDASDPSLELLRADLDRARMLAGSDLSLLRTIQRARDLVDARILLLRARERARRREPTEALVKVLDAAAKLAQGDAALEVEITLEAARLLARRGPTDEALAAIERIPEGEDPASLEAGLLKGLTFERSRRPAQALSAYRALEERDPQGAFGLTAQAAGHRLRTDPDEALTSADAALKVDGRCALALTERALALVARGDVDSAEGALSRILEETPDAPRALVGLGKLRLGEHKPTTATQALRAAIGLDSAEHDDEAETLLGLALSRQGQREEALRILNAVLERDPDRVDALLHRGALLLAEGERDAAARDWAKASERNAMSAQLIIERWHGGETLRAFDSLVSEPSKGEEDEEIFVLGQVREPVVRRYHTSRLRPLPGPVRDDVLDALVRAAKAAPLEDILYALGRGERMLPSSAALQLEKARILAGRDLVQAATKALDRARELGAEEYALPIQLLAAELSWRRGDLAAALEGFETVAVRDPSSADGLTARAQAHWLLGNREEALTSARGALKITPNHHVALTLVAMITLATGRADDALAPMRKAYERIGALDSRLLAVRAALIIRYKHAPSLDLLGQMRDMMSVEQHLTISSGRFCSLTAAALCLESDREDVQSWGQSAISRLRSEHPDAPDVLLVAGYAKLLRAELPEATRTWREAKAKAPALPFPRPYLERFQREGGSASDLAAFRKR